MAADQQGDWRTTGFRQRVVARIEEAVRTAGNPTSKTSSEMENHVFQKAQSREEYLALVARLIIHVREINSKQEKAAAVAAAAAAAGLPPGLQQAVIQDPINALTNLTKQGLGPGAGMPGQPQPQGQLGGAQGVMQQRAPFQAYQQQIMQARVAQAQQQGVQGMRADGFMMQAQQAGVMGQQQSPMAPAPQMGPAGPQVVQQRPPASAPQYTQHSPFSQPGSQASGPGSNQAVPSPVQPGSQSIHSPASLLPSPSPGSGIVPSPASQSTRTTVGAPSPGSMLNTPGNPGSVGAPSPQQRSQVEEQQYLDKLKYLQKYIDPLKRMISRIENNEERKKDLSKMTNLLDILTDSSKRLPMATLLKCEQVLEKLELTVKTSGATPPTTTTSNTATSSMSAKAPEHHHMCQPLMDAVAAHIKSPMLNHTLQTTFGPAVQALHGPPIRTHSPPLKRQRRDEDRGNDSEISNILQGEIARLEQRFKVNLDPLYHNGARTVHLICKLDDKNLPSVPPITVTVPENYPDSSPTCDTTSDDYDATPFLQSVQKALASRLLKLPDKYSVTALLDTWEMSVRQACAPVHSLASD